MRATDLLVPPLLLLGCQLSAQAQCTTARNTWPGYGQEFGSSVALSGDTLLVGDPACGPSFWEEGAVRIFERIAGDWLPTTDLLGPGSARSDHFGSAVAIDGDTLLVSAPEAVYRAGAVFHYERSGNDWNLQRRFAGSDTTLRDAFGSSLDLEGDRLVVGAPQKSVASADAVGAVYVFEKQAGYWLEVAKLDPPTTSSYQRFGRSVALSGDTILVSAPGSSLGSGLGEVHVFERQAGQWLPTTVWNGAGGFGWAVDLDRDRAVVAAPGHATFSGQVFVYERVAGAWTPDGSLQAPLVESYSDFGSALAIEGDRIVVGSPRSDIERWDAGMVSLFEKVAGAWVGSYLSIETPVRRAKLGSSLAMKGGRVTAGAPFEHTTDRGATYTFELDRCGPGFTACSGYLCPCDNDDRTRGCAKENGIGGRLFAFGSVSLSAADLVLEAEGLEADSVALFYQTPEHGRRVPYGDGNLCMEGAVSLAGVVPTDSSGSARSSWDASVVSGAIAGQRWFYQVVYRNNQSSTCGHSFNVTNSYGLVWQP